MSETLRPNRFHLKWWGWLLLVLAALLMLLSIGTSLFFQPWLKNKLITTVAEKSKGLYALQMHDLEASVWSGSITIENLSLTPDTSRLAELRKFDTAQAPSQYADLKAKRLHIGGISYLKLLRGKAPALSVVELESPTLVVNQVRKDTSTQKLYQRLPKNMLGLSIDRIKLTHAQVVYKKHGEKGNLGEVQDANLLIKNLKIDSASAEAKDRFFYTQQVQFTGKSADVLMPQGYYRLKTGAFSLNTQEREISVQKAQLLPLYKPAQLSRKVGHSVSHFQISVPTLKFQEVDFFTYSKLSNIAIGNILVQGAKLNIYNDSKNFQSVYQPLPHEMLQKVPMGLTIQKIDTRGTYIRYEELGSTAKQTGIATVTDLNVLATNLSNDKNRMSAKSPAIVKANFKIMGKAFMSATLRYNLLDPAGHHYIQGRVEKSNPAILNPILVPSMAIKVKSGTLHEGEFEIQASSTAATGTARFHYDDFKIDFLNKKEPGEEEKQSLGKKILSLVANKVVINTNNMPEEGKFRAGKIEAPRRKEKSIITFWIDALSSGIRSTLGVKEKKYKT